MRETAFEGLERQDMGPCEIGYVDVVTNTSPIGRLVVGPKNRDGIPIPGCGIQNERQQMRFGVVVLAYLDVRIGSRRVEIAQCYGPQLVGGMEIAENAFDHQLRGAVGIDWRLGQRL